MHLVLKDEKQFGFQDALWECLLLQRSERGFMSVSDSHGNIKQTFMECFCYYAFLSHGDQFYCPQHLFFFTFMFPFSNPIFLTFTANGNAPVSFHYTLLQKQI